MGSWKSPWAMAPRSSNECFAVFLARTVKTDYSLNYGHAESEADADAWVGAAADRIACQFKTAFQMVQ